MNALTEIQPQSPSNYSPSGGLQLELAKVLKLVAPISMTAEAQAVWIMAAEDALTDIRADEVAAVATEVKRSITRPSQIVPEIARLVAEKRARANRTDKPASPFFAEREITQTAQAMRAKCRTQRDVEEAWAWERNARADVGLHVPPIEKPLSARELASIPAHIVRFGLESGFLKRDGDAVVEVSSPEEIDRIRGR